MIRRLWAASVWAPGVVPEDDPWRTAKRVWLPLFDVIMMSAGVHAVIYGSLLLDRLYGDATDVIGVVFALVAFACLVGVVWPRMWPVEMIGKILLVSLIVGYVFGIVSMILGLIMLPIARLDSLIDEWVERRATRRRGGRA